MDLKHLNSKSDNTKRNFEEYDGCLSWLEGPTEQDDPKLLRILRTKFMDNPSTKPYSLSSDPFYNVGKKFSSWSVIHDIVDKIFHNKSDKGFFVEAGALDGEFLSNTLWLEKELGWSGLLIESNSLSYKKLLAKNRKAWSSNTCISTKPYPYQSIFVSVAEDKDYHTRYDSWMYKGASHLQDYTLSPLYESMFAKTKNSYSKVQCFPLYSYLLALNRTEIDLIILDIQGAEDDVLATIPFDKLRIKVFIVEHSAKNNLFDAAFKSFFEERGFQLLQCFGEPDYVFILRDEFEVVDQNISSCNIHLY